MNCKNCGTQIEPDATSASAASPKPSAPGQAWLQVTGLLHIILSTLGVISTASIFIGIFRATGISIEVISEIWVLYYIVDIVHGLFFVFVGTTGVLNCTNRKRANLLLGLGIANIAFLILSTITFFFLGFYEWLSGWNIFLSTLHSLALPILFIIGAIKNREQTDSVVS